MWLPLWSLELLRPLPWRLRLTHSLGHIRAALAGSPSEKPGSGQNHPPITSANPKAKRELAEKPGSEEDA